MDPAQPSSGTNTVGGTLRGSRWQRAGVRAGVQAGPRAHPAAQPRHKPSSSAAGNPTKGTWREEPPLRQHMGEPRPKTHENLPSPTSLYAWRSQAGGQVGRGAVAITRGRGGGRHTGENPERGSERLGHPAWWGQDTHGGGGDKKPSMAVAAEAGSCAWLSRFWAQHQFCGGRVCQRSASRQPGRLDKHGLCSGSRGLPGTILAPAPWEVRKPFPAVPRG